MSLAVPAGECEAGSREIGTPQLSLSVAFPRLHRSENPLHMVAVGNCNLGHRLIFSPLPHGRHAW